ncbi:hypothetical protein [Holdemanella porci]|jgi:hypothetical protein|uniref:hypothetical protein n=1 Tax=Holdemanella porci TaxID=2652276 RepID=UPI00206295D8|nr:MAG TPA_asm: Putative amidoligase enzyme [Caudoviricetes sp.]
MDNLVKYYDHNEFSFISMEKLEELEDEYYIEYSTFEDCYINKDTSDYGYCDNDLLTNDTIENGDYIYCEDTEDYQLEENTVHLEDTDETVSIDYDYQRCDECGLIFSRDYDMHHRDDDCYCDDCWEDMEPVIYEYHKYYDGYYPRSLARESPLFMGFELEVDNVRGDCESLASSVLDGDMDDTLHCEEDCTVAFEFISQPCTLEYHKNQHYNDWFFSELDGKCESHDAGTCGLHVHVNKSFFDDRGYDRLKTILFFFKDELFQFSRRQRWDCGYSDFGERIHKNSVTMHKAKNTKHYGHSTWFNENNSSTYEFRLFRGTLKYETFMASLELVHNICMIAMSNTDIITWDLLLDGDYCREYSNSREIYCDSELNLGELEKKENELMQAIKKGLEENAFINLNYVCVGEIVGDKIVFYCLDNKNGELYKRRRDCIDLSEFETFEEYGYYYLCNRKELSNLLGGEF